MIKKQTKNISDVEEINRKINLWVETINSLRYFMKRSHLTFNNFRTLEDVWSLLITQI